MTKTTMTAEIADWRRARRACTRAFVSTLRRLCSRSGVSERQFADEWMRAIRRTNGFSGDGWYTPPPAGASILAAGPPHFERLAFSSLREPAYFPGLRILDWRTGAVFAYCSNVFLKSGTPGDFSTTLYFGDDVRICEHFRSCEAAAHQIIDVALQETSSRKLFTKTSSLLSSLDLLNVVQSRTDPAGHDLGHSLEPCGEVALNEDGTLSTATCELISRSRRFINAGTDWDLREVAAFTIEPQLVSTVDTTLPKVSLHYTLGECGGTMIVDDVTESTAEWENWRRR